jgi:preprotein translocase subunit SecG
MTVFPLLAVGFVMKMVAALFIICCVSLILIILIQKGRGGGLSGAFGGAGAGGILGSKTGDFLTWVTIALVGVYLTLSVVMAKFYRPDVIERGENTTVRQELPASPEQPSASAGMGQTTSDVNAAADVNSPGG